MVIEKKDIGQYMGINQIVITSGYFSIEWEVFVFIVWSNRVTGIPNQSGTSLSGTNFAARVPLTYNTLLVQGRGDENIQGTGMGLTQEDRTELTEEGAL